MNWKLRFKNKTTLVSLIAAAVAFIYQACGIFGIVPPVSENEVIQIAGYLINILVFVGVVVDPTTEGLSDSYKAMSYTEPKPSKAVD